MNMPTFEAEDELARLRRGDPEALAAVIERYHYRLYRYLLHLSKDSATAEDLLQQTWLRVIEKIRGYDAARRFDVWLFSVARNLAIDYFRARRFADSLDEPRGSGQTSWSERLPASGPGALDQLLSSEQSALLSACVKEMAAIHREVLMLRFEEDLKLEEIAQVAGIPLSTVKSRLSRALDGLRTRVEGRLRGIDKYE